MSENADLQVLLTEYQTLRDDDRNAGTIQATLISIAALFLGAVSTVLAQSCQFQQKPPGAGCTDVPALLLATLPLAPLAAMSYSIMIGGTATIRYYYLRALESELQSRGATIEIGGTSMNAPAFMQISRNLVSLRAGKPTYRILLWLITGCVLFAFGGFIYAGVGSISSTPVRLVVGVTYVLAVCFLTLQAFRYSLLGREVWRDVVADLGADADRQPSRSYGRSISSYLLLPRPSELAAKSWFIAVSLLVGAVAVGADGTNWWKLILFAIAFEYLIYQARYQWNDIRGFAEDQRHPSSRERGRLPGPESKAVAHVWASAAVALARLLLGIYLAIAVTPSDVRGPVLISILLVFVVGIVYESLRSWAKKSATPPGARRARVWAAIICVVVGLGYPIRVVTGLWIGAAVPLPTVSLVLVIVCMWAFGCMFVTMTWAVEATSFVSVPGASAEDAAGAGASASAGDAAGAGDAIRTDMKPHIGVLGRLAFDERTVVDIVLRGGDPRDERVLAASNRLGAPWNIAFLVGVATSPAVALTLAGKLVAPAYPLVLPLAASSLLLGVLVVLSTPRRKLTAVVGSSALVAAPVATSVAAGLARPWISIFPIFVLVGIYWVFRVSSYNSLTKSLNNTLMLARKILISSLRGILSVLAGKETTRFLLERRRAGSSHLDTAGPPAVVPPDDAAHRTAGELDRS